MLQSIISSEIVHRVVLVPKIVAKQNMISIQIYSLSFEKWCILLPRNQCQTVTVSLLHEVDGSLVPFQVLDTATVVKRKAKTAFSSSFPPSCLWCPEKEEED